VVQQQEQQEQRIFQKSIHFSVAVADKSTRKKMTRRRSNIEHSCAECGTQENRMKEWGRVITLKECAACKSVCYCTDTCQIKHWKEHKEVCRERTRERQLKKQRTENLERVFDEEWVLGQVEDEFPSTTTAKKITDKMLLQEAKRVVDICCGFAQGAEDTHLTSLLFERLLERDCAPLKKLCTAQNEGERVLFLCENIMSLLLKGDTLYVEGLLAHDIRSANKGNGSGNDGKDGTRFLLSCRAVPALLGFFAGESQKDMIHPTSKYDYCDSLYNNKQATLYLYSNFRDHVQLCKVLCKKIFYYPELPEAWSDGCRRLMHLLVVCLSYPEPAEEILLRADQELNFHEETNKAGFKDYFRPLLSLFEVAQAANFDDILLHLCQTEALLVAHAHRLQQSPVPAAFGVHKQYLEQVFDKQFNSTQRTRWAVEYLPWAHRVVASRSG
jgi:hypothetical protein